MGRTRLLTQISDAFGTSRVVTVSGPAGMGKTRLAHHYAEQQSGLPVRWVDVWKIAAPWLVAYAIADGLPDEAPAEGGMLLIVDGADCWPDQTAAFAREVVADRPWLKVLITARDPIGAEGAILPLSGLEVPRSNKMTFEQVSKSEAVALFNERAGIHLTTSSAPLVAAICSGLGGNPLAIELVSSRATPDALAGLAQTFGVARGRRGDKMSSAVSSALDLAHSRLDRFEAAAYRHLGVFAGDCRLIDAAIVTTGVGDIEATACLESVARKIPVIRLGADAKVRLTQRVWEDCVERLRRAKEERTSATRHLQFFIALAEEADGKLVGPGARHWRTLLADQRENLWRALSSALDDEPDRALTLAAALGWYWYSEGHHRQGRDILVLALSRSDRRDKVRQVALEGVGRIAWRQQDHSAARGFLEENLALERELGDLHSLARALNDLGALAIELGDYPSAAERLSEGLSVMRELGDRKGSALVLTNLGAMARYEGDRSGAAHFFQESFGQFRALMTEAAAG
ncbi:MAG TPA: tetratricopeptide repeat protein [Candidatus Dormibacteraeota bacterium]|nr:tetratricopeptide repeat protein [Candidatus Dormibacteraeota bacterium]